MSSDPYAWIDWLIGGLLYAALVVAMCTFVP